MSILNVTESMILIIESMCVCGGGGWVGVCVVGVCVSLLKH